MGDIDEETDTESCVSASSSATLPVPHQSAHIAHPPTPINSPQFFHLIYYPANGLPGPLCYPSTPTPILSPSRPSSTSISSPIVSTTPKPRQTRTKQRLSASEKLDLVLEAIKDVHWTVGDFLYHLFRHKGDNEEHSPLYYQMVSKFLGGLTSKRLSHVLNEIIHDPWGIPKQGSKDRSRMFATDVTFLDNKAGRPALTSFAAQLVGEEMEKEVKRAVKKENGLHATKNSARDLIEGDPDGVSALEKAKGILKKNMPLSFNTLHSMASPHKRNRRSHAKAAKDDSTMKAPPANHRPPELVSVECYTNFNVTHKLGMEVVTQALSSIAFCRNRDARLLPLTKGLLMFSCRANRYLWSYESRTGERVSNHSILTNLRGIATEDGKLVVSLATGSNSAVIVRFDNVQKQRKPRFTRTGRDVRMLVGTMGTGHLVEAFNAQAVNLDEQLHLLKLDKRSTFTFDQYMELIDFSYIETALELEMLHILVVWVSELLEDVHRDGLRDLWNTEGTKRQVKLRRTQVFPLPTNGYNETATGDMNKSIRDLLKKLGQTDSTYQRRVWFASGDGLSYERLVQLANYTQFQDTEYKRLDFLFPVLESWHTIWTDLSRIYEAH
ncbi:hypothetical protein PM082_022894 [Marasmius tenuissimus]|nr:hypothetical protein PM082_022894 [Marasmius tenuissimus]